MRTVGASEWTIYWTAGAGVTNTPRWVLDDEVAVFADFLDALGRLTSEQIDRGRLVLSSSVGGVYAGNTSPPFDEYSTVTPLSDYGRAKESMERLVRGAAASSHLRVLVARITNLYGPGQDLSKGQGLISVIASTYFSGVPASIYVSLDTIRDYVFVGDCVRILRAAAERVGNCLPGTVVTKIIGSSTPVSIGALIGEFRRVLHHKPLIVLGAGDPRGQALDLRVVSRVWADLDSMADTSLAAGIDATYRSLLSSRVQPSL